MWVRCGPHVAGVMERKAQIKHLYAVDSFVLFSYSDLFFLQLIAAIFHNLDSMQYVESWYRSECSEAGVANI